MKLQFEQMVPPFATKVLGIGPIPQALRRHCENDQRQCQWMAHDADRLSAKRKIMLYDCILVGGMPSQKETLKKLFKELAAPLDPNGRIAVLIQGCRQAPCTDDEWDVLLACDGLIRYACGSLSDEDAQTQMWALTAVRQDYNPVLHARHTVALGRLDWAYEILAAIPPELVAPGCCADGLQREMSSYAAQARGAQGACQVRKQRPASPIYLGLVKGENYGWGVCSRYLIEELSKLRSAIVLDEQDGSAMDGHLPGIVFQALINVDLAPMFAKARGIRNCGYTFFENELTEASVRNAHAFDRVLGGSSWCRDRLLEKGIANCDVLLQGIDPRFFFPIAETADSERFVIFSGGKFELRKGQDLVLRAVKILQDKYPDVWLLNCWYNMWPAVTRLMTYSPHIRFDHRAGEAWTETMQRTYAQNGLHPERIITCGLVSQARQRALFAQTDIGLFPNRCEGGTNLVLMEYMACAKPVIASNTSGHKDIVNVDNALLLDRLSPFNIVDAGGKLIGRWQDPNLDEIVA